MRLTPLFALGKVGGMRSGVHWLLAVVLLLAPLMSSAAYAAASDADAPCPMTASDDAGHSPCGDCGDAATSCAQVCAMLGAGVLAASDPACALAAQPADAVAGGACDSFRSHAGPPGLQPPR